MSFEHVWKKGFHSEIGTNRDYFGDSRDAGFAEAWERFEEYFGKRGEEQ